MADADVPSSSILRISDEKTSLLIDLYKNEECLWNTKLQDYRNKVKRNEAVNKIARLLSIRDFGPRHVVMKFKNLRNSYSQELKKIAHSRSTGGDAYRPTVFWFDKMNSFIRPHLQKPRGGSKSSKASVVYLLDGTEEWMNLNNPEANMEADPSGSENESCDSDTRKRKSRPDFNSIFDSKRARTDSDCSEQTTITKTKDCNASLTVEDQQAVVSSLKDLSANLHVLLSRDNDYFESFGKYIAGLLRSLPHRKALEVQPEIIRLITAAGLEHKAERDLRSKDDRSVVVKTENYDS